MKNLLFLLIVVTVLLTCQQSPPTEVEEVKSKPPTAIQHPLDGLTAAEILQTKELLTGKGLLTPTTRVVDFTLKEPIKAAVYNWKVGDSIPRLVNVALWKDQQMVEMVVDLKQSTITPSTIIADAKPPIDIPDIMLGVDVWKKDERIVNELKRRGYTDLDKIMGAPLSIGYFGENDKRRLLNSTLANEAGPIEGIMAVVDLDAKEVVDVYINEDVGRNDKIHKWDKKSLGSTRRLKPIQQVAPEGNNYTFKDGMIYWDKWSFHFRIDKRSGPVISLVNFDGLSVAYQIAPAEMFVPYMDPAEDWSFRTFMDIGEYGFGVLSVPIEKGTDVPETATLLDANITTANGAPTQMKEIAAIFERNTGKPIWRHSGPGGQPIDSRAEIELVVRMIPVIGPYDYLVDYVFSPNGQLKIEIAASGIVTTKAVKAANMDAPTAIHETKTGTLVAPNLSGIFHDHFVSMRMDLDIGGANNSFVIDEVVPVAFPDNKRKSGWTVVEHPELIEGPISENEVEHDGYWRVVNKNVKNQLGQYKGYQIIGHDDVSILDKADYPQKRAAWSAAPLWITPYDVNEQFPSGKYPYQSDGTKGIEAWTAQKRSIDNTDLVCWYTFGFHHLPIPEDYPVMPTLWHTMTLKPYQSFDRSPAIDLE